MAIAIEALEYAQLQTVDTYLRTGGFVTPAWLAQQVIPLSVAELLVTAKIAKKCPITGTLSLVRNSTPPTFISAFTAT